jgi:hypothetical protein
LPYPGIETVLKLHVVETDIYPYQEITHIVEVFDTSRPFKATIVWMDPNNAVMTNRMLLNNLDLKVVTPAGQVLHGNNVAGDEVNNVSDALAAGWPPFSPFSPACAHLPVGGASLDLEPFTREILHRGLLCLSHHTKAKLLTHHHGRDALLFLS